MSRVTSIIFIDIDRYGYDADHIALLNLKNDLEAQHNLPGYKYNTFLNGELSFDEIKKAVKQLKKNKATGCDNMQNIFFYEIRFFSTALLSISNYF